ncbi:cytosolic carboxypeptidase-like protein 5 isoform X1 [Tribolium castaneum]|uniref:tubulin-glutamate carboxypeptidase n=1 Tax=Tribolium castaneum TaxID=7070 RepID=D7EIR9_TRICA|nr:PREDICTED: cytosolic carboxypeptidase-like protein 5 isoform X1 [Tribolium castaneum]XP_008196734.1 PREDICTED: cytosolic carboxypeptidase-like protein 5 isoform X1 [Tribolium castaneum]XP_008196741.1 PREDICTED: cytosolic carboxypeptidase-like protein 5 isoform X1 [Tribolium castaneum]XP_967549.1 PREDICTED: cytosolic carboxypeptidase-like protein 5 isoform X1 [Tribolium castaneum]EFA12270.1 carboxypeptidase A [Tribolium castaneum]|eukprot:XP_008196727.1 PREDICTED: cytosolic carboxypeptidase-like protein 5 isoform X1 [Tribolium castaneum]
MEGIECSGFTFYNEFDSANLAKVVYVHPNESVIPVPNSSTKSTPEVPDAEFNLWTKPDCCGTEFENGNRTWFYFGVKAHSPCLLVRLNIVDLNRQGKMYSQGMAPVYRTVPGKMQWERIRDKPIYNTVDDIFTLSFKFKTPENVQSITYFAFTYPFSYTDLQKLLTNIDLKFENFTANYEDDIYYHKEVVCRSLGGRDIHLLTISSYHGITPEIETRLKNLFPDKNSRRPFKFVGKKVVFVSARVHPGETPSSFVFNGFLNLLLTRDDPVAIMLRRLYVFKMIPFLNPDGVVLGHYRTDTRGVNLNRVYLNPILAQHPAVYAARALIRYYHYGYEKEDVVDKSQGDATISVKVSNMSLEEKEGGSVWCAKCKGKMCRRCRSAEIVKDEDENIEVNANESGLFLYIDLHGHASKKGIFMYGNHFQDLERNVECMLLPKLMSMNNHNFHFTACNFTERNMYLRDRRDGMSREGSGRVAVLKLTGLTKSYTLECNYNTGRIVNVLPATIKESHNKVHTILVPPKYTPQIFEEVGRSLGASILDLTGQNPCSRIPNSEFHSISGLKDWLRIYCANEMDETRPHSKIKLRNLAGLHNQGKPSHGLLLKTRPVSAPKRLANRPRPATVPIERKENMAVSSAAAMLASQPSCSHHTTTNDTNTKTFRLNKIKTKTKFKRNVSGERKIVRKQIKPTKKTIAEERKKLREICIEAKSEEKLWKDEAGPSRGATFIVHNFAKNSTFVKCKFKKHSLRRLTKSSPDAGKVDKVKKRKKLKSK